MSPAQELGQGRRGQPVSRNRNEEGEDGQALAEVDVLHLREKARVPSEGRPLELLRLTFREE